MIVICNKPEYKEVDFLSWQKLLIYREKSSGNMVNGFSTTKILGKSTYMLLFGNLGFEGNINKINVNKLI